MGPLGRHSQMRSFHMWLPLFQGTKVPAHQIHDFHRNMAPSGFYWVAPVPERGLTISSAEKTFILEVDNVAVVEQLRWPALESIAYYGERIQSRENGA
jgi:hypothetical protein